MLKKIKINGFVRFENVCLGKKSGTSYGRSHSLQAEAHFLHVQEPISKDHDLLGY